MKLRCRFGFHKNLISRRLITTGEEVCLDCRRGWGMWFGQPMVTLDSTRVEEIIKEYELAHP